MSIFKQFQLLELNIISAQDLAPVSRRMKSYAIAWVHSERKLTTRVDYTGDANPTWNDKFVFRVDEEFLYADTSAVMIEIYALHWFRDVHVGTVRVLISNLIPPNRRPGYRNNNKDYRRTPPPGMRFVALQVRRASGHPQGILNIGVGLLDGSMRSMPLYTNLSSSAVGYRDLMGEEDPHLQHLHLNSHKTSSKNPQSLASRQLQSIVSRSELRRTKSDTSSMVVSDLLSRTERSRVAKKQPANSELDNVPTNSANNDTMSKAPRKRFDSMDSEVLDPLKTEKPRTLPRLAAANERRKTPRRATNGKNAKEDYGSPYLSSKQGTPLRSNIVGSTPIRSNIMGSTPVPSNIYGSAPRRSNYMPTPMMSHREFGTPMRSSHLVRWRPILTESELGPSPSEVAAQMAKERAQAADVDSSILSEWSMDDSSIEGLRSKLERWRTELPPLYDFGSSHQSSQVDSGAAAASGGRSTRRKTPAVKKHNRRHTEGGNGPFSCFSSICGLECSIVCGSDSNGKEKKKKGRSGRVHRTASAENLSYL